MRQTLLCTKPSPSCMLFIFVQHHLSFGAASSGLFRQGSLVLPSSMDLTAYIGAVAQVHPPPVAVPVQVASPAPLSMERQEKPSFHNVSPLSSFAHTSAHFQKTSRVVLKMHCLGLWPRIAARTALSEKMEARLLKKLFSYSDCAVWAQIRSFFRS